MHENEHNYGWGQLGNHLFGFDNKLNINRVTKLSWFEKGHALRKIEGSPTLWTYKIQGTQHTWVLLLCKKLELLVIQERGCALRKIEGSPVLWNCKIWGAQHMICMKNLSFSSRPRAKVRRQRPLGSARAQPWRVYTIVGAMSCKFWVPLGIVLFVCLETKSQ